MRTLLFFTGLFPFGKGEAFIESEFPFLVEAFDKIIIVTNNLEETDKRPIPADIPVIRVPNWPSAKYKAKAVLNFFGADIQEELAIVRKHWPELPVLKIVPVLLANYANALSVSDLLEGLMKEYKLNESSTYIYSYWTNNMAAGVALFNRQHPQVKAFSRAHRWDLYFEFSSPPYLPLRKFILSNLDMCYSISKDGVKYLNSVTQNRLQNKIKLSLLGTFNYHNKRSPVNNSKTLKLVSCSSIYILKRVRLIVEALALIKDRPVEWIHFGNGVLMEEVEQLARERLSDNISYRFAGMTENKKVLEHYAQESTDLLINVSESEGIPVSIMEALSYGIPVIATAVGGTPEIIKPGINGELLPAYPSAEEVAEAIERFYYLSTEERAGLRAGAFETWSKDFNAQKNYTEFIDSIKQL